jgi:hypothetical protein
MGNTFSEVGTMFHKKPAEYQVVNVTRIIDDPLLANNKYESVSRDEIEAIKNQLSQLSYKVYLLNNEEKLSSPFKEELNNFYSVVNEQSEINLEDHKKMHDVICQLRQEVSTLKKEFQSLGGHIANSQYEQNEQNEQYEQYEQNDTFTQHEEDTEDTENTEDASPNSLEKLKMIVSPSLSVQEFLMTEKKLNEENKLFTF